DRDALRRLDRIDTVVLDAAALPRPAAQIERVVALQGRDPSDVARRVRALFQGGHPYALRRGEGARLERLRPDAEDGDIRRARHDLGDGSDILLLTVDDEPAALAAVIRPPAIEAAWIVGAARAAGYMVAIAGNAALSRRADADLHIEGGDHLTASIHMLQRDGCGVLLVSRRSRALAAADVGIGVVEPGARVPWGAHVLVPDWERARFLVEAAGVAHEVSRQSAAVALTGSGIGALSLLGGHPAGAGTRAMTAVNVAALFALANGTRAAVAVARRPMPVRRPAVPWHELTVAEALARADARPRGLTAAEVDARARPQAVATRRPSLARAFVGELANPLTPVLAGATVLAASVGSITDAALVATVTGANAAVGALQRFQVERALGALERDNGQRVRVRRDRGLTVVPASELVAGDVILLDAGSLVPADCRILREAALEVDESALTGESLPVTKTAEPVVAASPADRTSMLYAGTVVAAGTAEAVVVATGSETEAGIAAVGESVSAGGVERRLRDLTRMSIPVSALGGAGVVASALARGLPLAAAAQTGVGLAIAAVPEGLPALATVAQLSAARRLSRRGALARNPRAIEALGRVDVLCTDKTGTVTEGRIELALVSDGDRAVTASEAGSAERAVVAAAVAASPRARSGRPLPHFTDRAVLDAAPAWGVAVEGNGARHQDLPFESRRGYHAVVRRNGQGMTLFVKGAPEKLLPRCTVWRRADGDVTLGRREQRRLERHLNELARRGYRVLAVAQRPATGRHDLADDQVRDLVLLGFVALADPVRPSARDAAAALERAGVQIVMLTGDHPSTAQGVAEELSLATDGRVVTGAQLDALDDAALEARLDDIGVFARVTPAHKVRIVEAYRRHGRVVAMAGDGANDAAAIRLADVGVALGENATSAARSGADLVVADGRVETLIDAVVEGRSMWSSVRDAVALLVGGNLGEVAFTLSAALLTGRSPLSARQFLLVNLLTDTVPAVAIALRAPKSSSMDALLREGPDASLGGSLARAIYIRGGATAAGATAAWVGARATLQGPRTPTVTLVGLVGAQLGQTLVAGIHDPRVVAASVGSAAVMGLIVATPGVSQLFGCQPLDPVGWAVGLSAAALGTMAAVAVPRLPGLRERNARSAESVAVDDAHALVASPQRERSLDPWTLR
ncbi:MAG: cation-translocating P-type ATPase, partial [Acidimicrobiia bacterium]|nr:cation-translocating P-type ATPase [Acidimicrobiia bacterium]